LANHAEMPALCEECHAAVIAIADSDLRPTIPRWCEHRRTLAVAYKRGAPVIVGWELHLALTDADLKRHSEFLAELYATGQMARPANGGKP
jgi:hypothetical protein